MLKSRDIYIRYILCYRDPGLGYWIGLVKASATDTDGSFWLDNNPSTYRNWFHFRPGYTNLCILISDGVYADDALCTDQLRYICKAGKCWPIKFPLAVK